MGGSFSRGGEDIWVAVLVGEVRIFGGSFSRGGEDIWVVVLVREVKIFGTWEVRIFGW